MINNFIKMKKIIVMIILVVMFTGIVTPVFAAGNLSNQSINAIFDTKFISNLLSSFFEIIMSLFNFGGLKISGPDEVNSGSYVKLEAINAKGTVSWKSSNETIATVDKNGKVKGISSGKVIIEASSNAGTVKHDMQVLQWSGTTKKVSADFISKLNKKDLSGYYGGGKYNLTHFSDTNTASGITKSDCTYDNTNKWYTYNGKIAVAGAAKRWSNISYRNDIYYFSKDLLDDLYINIDGTWYEAIVIDVCGVSMNPNDKSGNYYDDGCTTNHAYQVLDIYTKSGSGIKNKTAVSVAILE